MWRALFAGLALLALASSAAAQDKEFVLSMGYGHVELNGEFDSAMESEGGFRFEPRFSWALNEKDDVSVRLGVGTGFSFYRDEDDSPGGVYAPDDFEELTLITPELQLSLRGYVAEEWFIEGGAGAGPIFGYYRAGETVFDFDDNDTDEWGMGVGVRPFIRTGYNNGYWTIGIEASYQYGYIDFDDELGDDVQEFYAGLFFGLCF